MTRTEKAHLVTDPKGDKFVARSGADNYTAAKGYKVEKVEGHAEKRGFKVTKRG